MSWDSTPATGGGGSWNSGNNDTPAGGGGGWYSSSNNVADGGHEDINGHENGYDGLDSKHAGGNSGECYNCGQTGHNKADCPNPSVERPFTGTCRVCDQEGHRAADCPEKPAQICKACANEGHIASECTGARLLYDDTVPILGPDEAWKEVKKCDATSEVDLLRKALKAYTRANPNTTFVEVEDKFRSENMKTFLVGMEQTIPETHTAVNLQGKTDCKFVVTLQLSPKPLRPKFATGYPASPEENKTRLAEGGMLVDRMIPKCLNCREIGHMSKNCPQERREVEKVEIKCVNCGEPGHRIRNCPQAREERAPRTCRNCNQPGHIASDCTEPRSAENVECRGCGQMGHFSRDCPTKENRGPMLCRNCNQEGHKASDCTNERVMICRNCEKEGHMSRECPEPRDYSKVQCRNCAKFGHSAVRCTQPTKEEGDTGHGATDAGASTAVTGGWHAPTASDTPPAVSGGWEANVVVPDAAAIGGNSWGATSASVSSAW